MGYMDVTQIKFEINFLKYVLDTFIFKGSDLYFLIWSTKFLNKKSIIENTKKTANLNYFSPKNLLWTNILVSKIRLRIKHKG